MVITDPFTMNDQKNPSASSTTSDRQPAGARAHIYLFQMHLLIARASQGISHFLLFFKDEDGGLQPSQRHFPQQCQSNFFECIFPLERITGINIIWSLSIRTLH